MRLSISIICVTLGLTLVACGKKKKTEPDPNTSEHNNDVVPQRGPQGPQGPQGNPGDQGPQGLPGGTLNYTVKDATGHVIGKTSWDHYVRFNAEDTFSVQLTDGAVFPVNPKDGTFAGGVFCQYTSSDCSGACLYSGLAGIRNKIIEGSAGLYWLNTASQLTAKNYSSSWSVNVVNGSKQCSVEPSPVATMAVELSNLWTKPAGFTYPVPVPMDVSETTSGLNEFED